MDQDPDSSPLDDLRHYAYEGDGKLIVVADISTLDMKENALNSLVTDDPWSLRGESGWMNPPFLS